MPLFGQKCLIGPVSGEVLITSWKSTFSLFGYKSVWLVRSVEKYWPRDTCTMKVGHSSQLFIHSSSSHRWMSWLTPVQKNRPPVTCYQRRKGKVCSIIPHSPAKYPIATKKRKKSDKKKKTKNIKKEPGKSVQFQPKVTLETIYTKLKNHLEEVDLTKEDDYPSRVTAFALKWKSQKERLKYQHQYCPLTPRRMSMLKHIRDTLQRENGNQSSLSPSQTLPTNSTQTSF